RENIVRDAVRDGEAARRGAPGGGLPAHDGAGVGRVVAADIEEIADVVPAAAVEDLLAIGLIGLVAGRAEGRRWRTRNRFELGLVDGGQVEQPFRARLHKPTHAVARAEYALDLA